MRMGAGELDVEGGSPRLLDADFDYDNSAMKPLVRYEASSFRGQLTIEQPRVHESGGSHYEWKLRLNNDVPLDVVTHLGAGNAEMNLGAIDHRRGVEVGMGVGNLDMDLRGDPEAGLRRGNPRRRRQRNGALAGGSRHNRGHPGAASAILTCRGWNATTADG